MSVPLTRDQWVRLIAVSECYAAEDRTARFMVRIARDGLRMFDELEQSKVSA